MEQTDGQRQLQDMVRRLHDRPPGTLPTDVRWVIPADGPDVMCFFDAEVGAWRVVEVGPLDVLPMGRRSPNPRAQRLHR